MRRPAITPSAYRRITLVAFWLLVFIVVTGAAVRLTDSGLGCTEWPNCEPGRLTAHRQSSSHEKIESLNRTITGLVSVSVIAAVLGSLVRRPRRRDLTRWSLGLVLGVVAQIVLGGLLVLADLDPRLVQLHFILSMVLVADAVVLHHRAGLDDRAAPADGPGPSLGASTGSRWSAAALALAAVVLVTGTVVTGSGPHAGDRAAERLGLGVEATARVHSLSVMAFLGVVVLVAVRLRRDRAPAAVFLRAEQLLVVLVLQAALGYTQYFTGVPALLVGLHVLGATLMWVAVLRLHLGLTQPSTVASAPEPDRPPPLPVAVVGR